MTIMEEIVDTVAVDTDWSVGWDLVLGQMGIGFGIDFGFEIDILGFSFARTLLDGRAG